MVTYLYEYRNGVKGTGAGFLKLDSRGDDCRIQLCLQGRNVREDHGRVFFVVKQEKVTGIPLGEVTARQGIIGGSWMVNRENICGSTLTFSDVEGMAVKYPSGRYLVGSWIEEPDEELVRGDFEIWNDHKSPENAGREEQVQLPDSDNLNRTEEPKRAEDAQQAEEPTRTEDAQHAEELQPVEEPQQMRAPQQMEPSVSSRIQTTERIDISDIRKLPKKNWHLCSNSFVIHGFFNYHYLVCILRETEGVLRQYLGVPGVYAKPERAMAMLFGFPEFEVLQSQRNGEKEPLEGTFGYWCCQLEMQDLP